MIIRDTTGQLFDVHETGNPDLAHVWIGIEVKKTKAGYVPKAKARKTLVRKEATIVVEA